MKTKMTVLFVGAMLASVAMASGNDQMAEERFKAKTGRYTPTEESQRRTLAHRADHSAQGSEPGCCHRERVAGDKKQIATSTGWTEEFLSAKLGRQATPNRTGQVTAALRPVAFADGWLQAKSGRASNETSELAALMCERPGCCD